MSGTEQVELPQVVGYDDRHEEALRVFLREGYPDSPLKADIRFLRWRFQQGPHGDSTPHCFVALVRDRVVGQLAALRDRVWVDGAWRDCVWLLDLMILPSYRGGSTALRLFQAAMASAELLLGVGAGPRVIGFYKALRWEHIHVADTVFAPLNPHKLWKLAAAAETEDMTWRETLLKAAAPVCRFAQAMYTTARSTGGGLVEVSPSLPHDIPELEKRLRNGLGITTDRSMDVLQWKFTRRPFGKHFFVAVREPGGRHLRAYAGVKVMQRDDVRWAEVVDYLAEPGDRREFQRLLAAVVCEALRLRLDFVRLRCSIKEHLAALPKPFWIVRNRYVIDDLLIYSKDKRLVEALRAGPWHLTTIVSDRTDHGADETMD